MRPKSTRADISREIRGWTRLGILVGVGMIVSMSALSIASAIQGLTRSIPKREEKEE